MTVSSLAEAEVEAKVKVKVTIEAGNEIETRVRLRQHHVTWPGSHVTRLLWKHGGTKQAINADELPIEESIG